MGIIRNESPLIHRCRSDLADEASKKKEAS